MRAILLAAGLGTRLRPLTDRIPKCLVPIDGRPLIDIWLEELLANGVESVLVNCHYLAQQVVEHISNGPFATSTKIVHEATLLGTAGTLIANRKFLDDNDGILIHADNYSEASIRDLLDAHSQRPSRCTLTMLTFRSPTPESCGIVEIDSDGVVIGYEEKPQSPTSNLANGAVYVLSSELVESLSGENDFSTEVLPRQVGRIYTHETFAPHVDVGTPGGYSDANQFARYHREINA